MTADAMLVQALMQIRGVAEVVPGVLEGIQEVDEVDVVLEIALGDQIDLDVFEGWGHDLINAGCSVLMRSSSLLLRW